jgi:hypothetical protein
MTQRWPRIRKVEKGKPPVLTLSNRRNATDYAISVAK